MAKTTDLAAVMIKVHGLLKGMTQDERQKVVSAVMTLFGETAPTTGSQTGNGGSVAAPGAGAKFTKSLATYLTEQKANDNQNRRFLATADWLRQRGVNNLSSSLVSKTLKDNNQKRLGNASECLNQNAGKGLVEKDAKNKTFFITHEGLVSLGHEQ